MLRSTSRARLGLVGAIAFTVTVLWHATAFAAPTATWDQARVAGIAKQLVKVVDKLYDQEHEAAGATEMPAALGMSSANHEFADTLRRLQHEARHLAVSLEKGKGAKETKGSVRQIKQLNDDLAMYGRQMEFVNPVLDQFSAVEDQIHQLAPYYGLEMKR
jgi:hypothetical protein